MAPPLHGAGQRRAPPSLKVKDQELRELRRRVSPPRSAVIAPRGPAGPIRRGGSNLPRAGVIAPLISPLWLQTNAVSPHLHKGALLQERISQEAALSSSPSSSTETEGGGGAIQRLAVMGPLIKVLFFARFQVNHFTRSSPLCYRGSWCRAAAPGVFVCFVFAPLTLFSRL